MNIKTILIFLATFFFLACTNSDKSGAFAEREEVSARAGDYPPTTANAASELDKMETAPPSETLEKKGIKNSSGEYQRKLIKTAYLDIEVEDYYASTAEIKKLLKSFRAEIHQESEKRTPYSLTNSLVIKVVPEEFDELIGALTNVGLNILRKDINSTDVSEEYYDLKTRLDSKRAVLKRYREILKSAKNIKEILLVEEKLRIVSEEIESAEGRLRYLNAQVGMSTINLHLTQVIEQPNIITKKHSFWKKLARSFSNGFDLLQGFLLGVTTLWPFLLLIPLIIWGYRRIRRR